MKAYEFKQVNDGNVTITALIIKPTFNNGILKAVKIGEPTFFDADGNVGYKDCGQKEFFVAGNYILEEFCEA